jgi:DmsE family decaheme c-type cytochrome
MRIRHHAVGLAVLAVTGAVVLTLPSPAEPAQGPPRAATSHVRGLDWTAIDPAFEGASFLRDDSFCADCHDESIHPYEATRHGRATRAGGAAVSCESCHGPRSRHVEDPGTEIPWNDLEPAKQSAICQQCHQGGIQHRWRNGVHHLAGVSCTSCHAVMEERSEEALLARAGTTETCLTCHAEVRADMLRTSHHPVREGRLDCASCHEPHGSTAPALLRGNTLNETCTSCHSEKRGPFLWEHAPVRESCATCHDPHGSNNRNLLVKKDSFVCLQCHSYGGHINLPRYNRTSNPYGNGCSNCHMSVHGSNHPSGAKLTR